MKVRPSRFTSAFTLLELLVATAAAAIILLAIYGVFSKAMHLRQNATDRMRDARVRTHAAAVIRNDLINALVSGGQLAATLSGSQETHGSSFPGYLKFTTTTGTTQPTDVNLVGDIQQVEYYILNDPDVAGGKSGLLVRAAETNLLTTVQTQAPEQRLLAGVESFAVSFFDGQNWQESWEVNETNKTLPQAIRVRIQPASETTGTTAPLPIEILVPWTTQPAIATASTTAGGTKP
jgi:type II secretion system protein J